MTEDIRHLKGPAQLWDWWTFLGWTLLVLLAAAVLFFAVGAWQRRGRGLELPVPAGPPKPPHELALEALSRLENSDLLRQGRVKLFYIELSDILRHYLGGRFEMDTLDRTTWEIGLLLNERGTPLPVYNTVREILEESDLVKFAKYQPSGDVPLKTLERVRKLVRETMPQVEPVAQSE